MASFSDERPWAFHAMPIHFVKRLLSTGALLAKSELTGKATRRTTSEVDRALGFAEFVHFYLPRRGVSPATLPIVAAQLGPSTLPPVPHVVFRLDTARVDDGALAVCNWNIAVGAPKVEGVHKGGNWTRGTKASVIANAWKRFREARPDRRQRRGNFHDDMLVPVLRGDEITQNLDLIREDHPELLVSRRVPITLLDKVFVFSKHDRRSLELIDGFVVDVEEIHLDGYSGETDLVGPRRKLIDDYFVGKTATEPSWDHDARRPKRKKDDL